MVKFELPKLASRVQFPSPAPCKKKTAEPSFFTYNEVGIEPETQAIQSERAAVSGSPHEPFLDSTSLSTHRELEVHYLYPLFLSAYQKILYCQIPQS